MKAKQLIPKIFVINVMRLLLKYFLLLPFFFTCFSIFAQDKSWDNWYFGRQLGMSFDGGNRTIETDSEFSTIYGPASFSDPQTGQLLFITDGRRLFDRNFTLINANSFLQSNLSMQSMIVPVPADADKFYIITVSNQGELSYAIFDRTLRNELGDISQTMQNIQLNSAHHFTLVKRLYGDGYWLITHIKNEAKFQVYSITKNGINLNPVVSEVGKLSSTTNWIYGAMVSTKTGEEIAYAGYNFIQVFNFDKECGTLSLKHDITSFGNRPYLAYSWNDRYLYFTSGGAINRADMAASKPELTVETIGNSDHSNSRIALAPDGLIYCTEAESSSVTSLVSVIHDVDSPQYRFEKKSLNLNPHLSPGSGVENWPIYMMDWSPKETSVHQIPEINFEGVCVNEQISFDVTGNFRSDSVKWELGDGTFKFEKQFKHSYAKAGTYQVLFNWYLCGFQYSVDREIVIGKKFNFSFGADTVLCPKASLTLKGPAGASRYEWSNGSTDSILEVTSGGKYWLKAYSDECFTSDSIQVNYRSPILVELGEDHFVCEESEDFEILDAGKGFEAYKWTPTGDTTQWIIVEKAGSHYVVVSDFRGCTGSDETEVESLCPVSFSIPNAFSPNGDGINDIFKPIMENVVDYEISIFNRWGEKVFYSESLERGWDGFVQGVKANSGVYFYVLNYSGFTDEGAYQNFNVNGQVNLFK